MKALTFAPGDSELIWRDLVEASNAQAEAFSKRGLHSDARSSRGAANSLSNLASRVIELAR